MALRCLKLGCFWLLGTLVCAALAPQATTAQIANTTQTSQASTAVAAPLVEPKPAEMRAMAPDQLETLGDKFREEKNFLAALDCYREAVRKQAGAMLYTKIAITELQLKHPGQAEKAAKKAVHKDKHLAEAWNCLGVAYYMEKRYDKAIHVYERAISLRPGSASFHNNLAVTLMENRQMERGVAEYRKAFELDPAFFEHVSRSGITAQMSIQDRAQFSFVMARLFASNGDLDRALHFLRSAIEDGYPKIDDVYKDKEFATVVKDERFLALMKDRPVAVR